MAQRPVVASLAHADEQRISVRVDVDGDVGLLEYVGQGPTWLRLPPTLDFAAVALVHLAAARGLDLHVEGPVSRRTLDGLAAYVEVWATCSPQLAAPVTVTAAEQVDHVVLGCRRGAALAFDNGVASSFALAAHADGLLGRRSREISTGVLAVGLGLRNGDEDALTAAQEAASRTLSHYGAGTRVVATNWCQRFGPPPPVGTQPGLVALLQTFGGDHDAVVVGTSHAYPDEPAALPPGRQAAALALLGAEHTPVVPTGGTHRRLDRLAHLRAHPLLLRHLRFCQVRPAAGDGCGRCRACVLVQLEMRAMGLDPAAHVRVLLDEADVTAVRVEHAADLLPFQAVAERLASRDPLRPALLAMVRRERRACAERADDPAARAAEALRRELAAVRAELDTVLASRSWAPSGRAVPAS